METYSLILGILVLITQIAIVVLIAGLIFPNYLPHRIKQHLNLHSMKYALGVAFAAFLAPLGFSDIYGFPPCFYCWYQRIFMFPTTIILALGTYRKEVAIKPYAMMLAITGACISLYHVLLQWSVISSSSTPCSIVGQSVTCNTIFVHEFGYITIPMMALTAFVGIVVLLGYQK